MLTFETLSKIAREEKASQNLTKLPEGFLESVAAYLSNKAQASEGKEDGWELENAKMVLHDILKIRERKVLLSALGFMDSGVEPANLSPEERAFFGQAASLIMQLRTERGSFIEARQAKKPVLAFLEDVPQFVGTDLNNYGPFGKGDVANLPEDVSNVLVERGAARLIEAKRE